MIHNPRFWLSVAGLWLIAAGCAHTAMHVWTFVLENGIGGLREFAVNAMKQAQSPDPLMPSMWRQFRMYSVSFGLLLFLRLRLFRFVLLQPLHLLLLFLPLLLEDFLFLFTVFLFLLTLPLPTLLFLFFLHVEHSNCGYQMNNKTLLQKYHACKVEYQLKMALHS